MLHRRGAARDRACQLLDPSAGGINLEDIRSPECCAIEERLRVHVMQSGSDVNDIVNLSIIAAVDAQERTPAPQA